MHRRATRSLKFRASLIVSASALNLYGIPGKA
jgi:hypothetical protein